MRLRQIGITIVAVSLIVLSLLIFLKLQTDSQMLSACEKSCGELGSVSCSLDSCPYHQGNDLSWVLILMSILVAFMGGTGVYLSLPRKTEEVIEEKEYDLAALSEEEKKIFLFIKAHKEGVYQSRIVKEFDLTKVQATRLLDKMEGLEFVERKRRGLANIVAVKS